MKKVSVCMITYNHEQYIRQAVESVMMQKTDFDYELIIGEDCSADNTRKIVQELQREYPDKIRLILHDKNIGVMPNFTQTIKTGESKYISLLEGDDYWTDSYKLQKQVDLLEAHPDFSFCFTNAYNLMPEGELRDYSLRWKGNNLKEVYTMEDIMFENFVPTASIVFRNYLFKDFPPLFYKAFAGDWILNILNAKYGDIGFIDEITCVRRIHAGGIVSMKSELFKVQANINLINIANELLEYKYNTKAIKQLLIFHKRALDILLKEKKSDEAKEHIDFCIKHGFYDKSFSRKKLVKIFLQVHFPAFYSVFFRLRTKFS